MPDVPVRSRYDQYHFSLFFSQLSTLANNGKRETDKQTDRQRSSSMHAYTQIPSPSLIQSSLELLDGAPRIPNEIGDPPPRYNKGIMIHDDEDFHCQQLALHFHRILCTPNPSHRQTDRQTDRRTDKQSTTTRQLLARNCTWLTRPHANTVNHIQL